MKKPIRIGFADFKSNWSPYPDYVAFFVDMLKDDFDVSVVDDPDYVFCSVPGSEHLNYKCIKIFFPGENRRPDFENYQWSFTYDFNDDPRHYRLPMYAMYGDVYQPLQPKPPIDELWDRKFCCVLFGKSPVGISPREDFFYELSKYKQVDSAGRHLKNVPVVLPGMGGPPKVNFIKDYKFVLAFENFSYPGYTTEKVFEPMLANSCPIYWGNPLVGKDFNTRSFVNSHEYENLDKVIERVIELDQNKEEYAKAMSQPYYVNNEINSYVKKENILKHFHRIFA